MSKEKLTVESVARKIKRIKATIVLWLLFSGMAFVFAYKPERNSFETFMICMLAIALAYGVIRIGIWAIDLIFD